VSRPPPPRPALSTQRVIDAASRVADASGLGGVSMRSVGRELDVEAMSLYHHVASKEALLGLLESRRSPGPATLHHHDAVLGCLRTAGFSVAMAAHAFSVLDAYVYGFVLTEVNLPFGPDESAEEFVGEIGSALADHPYLAEMVAEQVVGRDYRYGDEFDYGLALVLDGIEAAFGT
jgi:hypothetical protein